MNRQIPGMYWDNEKKKYFAIQPNHVTPAGAPYSADRVKRLKLEEENALARARNVKITKDLIRRSRAFYDPLVGGSLTRELGSRQDQDACVRTLSQGLEGQEVLRSEESEDDISHLRRVFPLQTTSTVYINDFAYDVQMDCLLFPVRKRWIYLTWRGACCAPAPSVEGLSFRRRAAHLFWSGFGDVTTINFNPHNRLVLATWLNADQRTKIIVTKLHSSRSDPLADNSYLRNTLGPVCQDISVSCATYANINSGSSFVIGSKRGVFLVDKEGSGFSMLHGSNSSTRGLKDTLAVECSKDGPSLILTGNRNGVLNIFDVRCPNSVTAVIQHASSICHIKHVKDVVITVSGLKSTLCNYDQRFIKNRPLVESWPEVYRRHPQEYGLVTAPIFTYPEHENDAWVAAGFDIDTDTGVAAAAQTGTSTAVKIFSLKSGKLLRTVDPTRVGHTADPLLVRAIRFVPDYMGSGRKNLWVAKGSKVVAYKW